MTISLLVISLPPLEMSMCGMALARLVGARHQPPGGLTQRVEGIYRIMRSEYPHPLNLGTDELVTVNQLVDLVAEIAGKRIIKRHDLSKPQGVRGRNSDNTKLRRVLGWEPQIPLREGLVPTYHWIASQLENAVQPSEPAGQRYT